MTDNPEIGRELTIADLKPKQIVVISPPEKEYSVTMWVRAVDDQTVVFFAGEMNWSVINLVKDGQIVDDQDRVVRVFEYLGEP